MTAEALAAEVVHLPLVHYQKDSQQIVQILQLHHLHLYRASFFGRIQTRERERERESFLLLNMKTYKVECNTQNKNEDYSSNDRSYNNIPRERGTSSLGLRPD